MKSLLSRQLLSRRRVRQRNKQSNNSNNNNSSPSAPQETTMLPADEALRPDHHPHNNDSLSNDSGCTSTSTASAQSKQQRQQQRSLPPTTTPFTPLRRFRGAVRQRRPLPPTTTTTRTMLTATLASAAAASTTSRPPSSRASGNSSGAAAPTQSGADVENTGNTNNITSSSALDGHHKKNDDAVAGADADEHDDRWNYALLVALYTLQGIPMGLSSSIPFLIQQKLKALAAASATAAVDVAAAAAADTHAAASAAKLSYQANAIFALCSWPFSLKLLWAPVVDACFFRHFGRRKSWLVPIQTAAGLLMVTGSHFVERQLGLDTSAAAAADPAAALRTFNVKGVTAFFFVLYFFMATQDIAVDGWALTLLSKRNRGRGPVCNSIGQNIGYFLSFVGFLALNDAEASNQLWRPLLRLPLNDETGLVSLGGFIRFMGYFMLVTTTLVAVFKRETPLPRPQMAPSSGGMPPSSQVLLRADRLVHDDEKHQQPLDEEHELDASELGLQETYRRLWAVCQLPAVQWLFVVLLTYRLPTALNDNVKFLKAVEYGLSKSTTALLSPTVILPLGILVPLLATRWGHHHSTSPLSQFLTAYRWRVTAVPLLDALLLWVLRRQQETKSSSNVALFWTSVVASTAMQAICASWQFNAQMTFFASRVDPAIGGSYMTLLNTAANLGGTYPASLCMWLVGTLTQPAKCHTDETTGQEVCTGGWDPFATLQVGFCLLGCVWLLVFTKRVQHLAHLPEEAWRTHLLDDTTTTATVTVFDEESPRNASKDAKHE